jgi:hypothetical protein
MKLRRFSNLVRAGALALCLVGIAVLAMSNAAWAHPTQDPSKPLKHSTVPRRDADLSITKECHRAAGSHDDWECKVTVHNAGPVKAVDVRVTDEASKQLFLEKVKTTKGKCDDQSDHKFKCRLGDLNVGQDVIITARFDVEHFRGTVRNTARVSSNTPDSVPGNNSVSYSFRVP